ncbi:MAG TPA: ASKHA domain-containing protein [Candidatus Hydrogenedentes bacterium]|nr:ASKHA domain-containing protein [Candidatus Hydrogenedentota bacterium]HRT19442.1 ASKHA domain-containing protein [Candidatus Hydrogenedentota bacterium]HRT63824.1 ASKHA domain-containing protein [Candidatus Hydrogenedentota bacterium]
MREAEIPVTFQPHGRTVFVLKDSTLLEAAAQAGIAINTPCGGGGTCGKCKVRVMANAEDPCEAERATLSAAECKEGYRLSCQTHIHKAMTVDIPETSVLASTFQILSDAHDTVTDVSDATLRKIAVELPVPDRGDAIADTRRIERAIGPFTLDFDLLRILPLRLRQDGFRGTAVLADGRLLDFEPGDTRAQCHAVALDIGTTTLAGALLDLTTGRECANVARMNPQTRFGDDVISRIQFTRQESDGLQSLHEAILNEANDMIAELGAQAGVSPKHIYEVVISGNTTMQQIFTGINPAALGEAPFTPACADALSLRASELGIRIHPRGRVYAFPVIGGFVGGDTVAGILATSLPKSDGPTMLVDIGTNGEIVVGHKGRLIAASTAAGPAFEGARIMHGMRATAGAIEKVLFDGDVRISVIGDAPPVGLCGSALIDAVAELLRHGMLLGQGMLLGADDVPDTVPRPLRKRLVSTEDGPAFVLANGGETATGNPVLLTQKDIREVQLATAAIRSGVAILMRRIGLRSGDLERVLIAGGFGNFIRRSNAQRIGLLPGELDRHRIQYAGNTSLAGARLAAASKRARERAEEWARQVEHVDLSLDVEFQNEYVSAMFFPE